MAAKEVRDMKPSSGADVAPNSYRRQPLSFCHRISALPSPVKSAAAVEDVIAVAAGIGKGLIAD